MKRFIWILTFLFTFLAGKADTIGHNHVYLRDRMLADFPEGQTIRLQMHADSVAATDLLVIDRYYGCGGSPGAQRGVLIIRDSATQEIIYRDTVQNVSKFEIPMRALLDYQRVHSAAIFSGYCVVEGVGEAKMRYWNGVRFAIRLE